MRIGGPKCGRIRIADTTPRHFSQTANPLGHKSFEAAEMLKLMVPAHCIPALNITVQT